MQIQREIPMLAGLRKPALVSDELVLSCRGRLDAIRLCIQLSRFPHQAIAEKLGIDKGHSSRIMQGQAHFPDDKANDLMRLCGNFAPLQYEAMTNGFELHERAQDARIRELQAEIERLKSA